MRPGPRPQPVALKLLRGNPGKRRLPAQTAAPTPGADCPAGLGREAKREWDRVLPELQRLGLVTQLDRARLAVYCRHWQDYQRSLREIDRRGYVVSAGNGTPIPNPWLAVKRAAEEGMRKSASEFGFSPADRARLEFGGAPSVEDDDDRFFGPQPAPQAPPSKGRR